MISEFSTASKIIIGAGAINRLGQISTLMGKRAVVFCGTNTSRISPLYSQLEDNKIEFITIQVDGEPTTKSVQESVNNANNFSADWIVGIGGGAVLDSGKAVSILMNNPGDIYDYLEVIGKGAAFMLPAIPYIAIPTTAGTGTEVTKNAVIGSKEHHVKVSLRSEFMIPRVALIDPELTYTLPEDITASSGLDAFTQLIEPYVSVQPNPITDALCIDGIQRVAKSIRNAYFYGDDPQARMDMSIASLFSGLALANAKLGAVHGFAGPLGGMYDAPHGMLCASLLPHVIEANVKALEKNPVGNILDRYKKIAEIILGENTNLNKLIDWVFILCRDLNIPPLSTLGIVEDDFDLIVSKASVASSMKGNPVSFDHAQLMNILYRAL